MFDRGRRTRFDLSGHAVIHTAPNVRKAGNTYEPVSIRGFSFKIKSNGILEAFAFYKLLYIFARFLNVNC